MGSIPTGMKVCVGASFCDGADALAVGCHVTFLCGSCVGVIF